MSSALFTISLYMLSVLFFFNCSSSLTFWLLLEINVLCFSVVSISWGESLGCLLYYFLIQTFGSFLFMVQYLLDETLILSVVSLVGLSIKMGAVPFQFWVLNLIDSVEWKTFLILLTMQKIPSAVILFSQGSSLVLLICLLNMIIGSAMLFYSNSFKELIAISSIYMNYWNYIMISLFPMGYVFFYTLYSVSMYFSLKAMIQSSGSLAALAAFFFMGLPPFSIFYLKFYFVYLMSALMSWSHFALVWVTAFLCVIGYLKYFISKLSFMYSLEKEASSSLSSLLFFYFSFILLMSIF